MIALAVVQAWLQQQIGSYVFKKSLDVSIPFLFRKNALITAISITIKKTCTELELDSADYSIRKMFGKHKEIITLIKDNYKTNSQLVVTEMRDALIDIGIDFGVETLSKTEAICTRFIEIFTGELPKLEKVPISTFQTAESSNKMLKTVLEQVNKIAERQEQSFSSLSAESISVPQPKTVASFSKDSDDELANSKYKDEIDKAKILLDSEQHEAAKVIYEKLLEDFKTDDHVPTLAKFKVYNNLGACLAALGMTKEAASHFKIAFEVIGPTSLIACKNRALASFFEGKPLEGLPFIDAAIAIEPNNNDCVNLKATLLRAAGQFDKVFELYTDEGGQDENQE